MSRRQEVDRRDLAAQPGTPTLPGEEGLGQLGCIGDATGIEILDSSAIVPPRAARDRAAVIAPLCNT
jgi:hypothetical protein